MSLFEPVFSGIHSASRVVIEPTAIVGTLSISVEDQSSSIRVPQRLWAFLDRDQIRELHAALGEWLDDRD